MWRLFQMVIMVSVSGYLASLAKPGQHFGAAPWLFGLFAAYVATALLSRLIDFVRWLGLPARTVGLHDQTSDDRASLTAVRLQIDQLSEQPPRPRIRQHRR